MLQDLDTRIARHQRSMPDGWTADHWANELERRAQTADQHHPKVAATFRRWAAETRDEAKAST